MVPFGDTQPLVAVVVLAPSAGTGPWSGVPGLGGACRGLPARVGRSNSVAGPGELAKGLLPVWGSDEATVRVAGPCSSVPSESGVWATVLTAGAGVPDPAAHEG